MVLASRKEEDRDAFQATDIGGCSQVGEEWTVRGHKSTPAHLHQDMQEGHVDAAKEAVDLAMSCFVEIAMIPESTIEESALVLN